MAVGTTATASPAARSARRSRRSVSARSRSGSTGGGPATATSESSSRTRYLPENGHMNRYTGTTRTTEPRAAANTPVHDDARTRCVQGPTPHEQGGVPVYRFQVPDLPPHAPEWERAYWRRRLFET